MNKELFQYLLIRTLTFPIRFLPYRCIHFLGIFLGFIAYHTLTKYRKKALSNLALASSLQLTNKQIYKIAKESFVNLAINCLEYPKFYYEKDFSKVFHCINPQIANKIVSQGKGIIFLCGHQSNWEVLFLDGTLRMKGVAIGKAIKNKTLYKWIISIREKNGGKIISPHNAVREGFRALRKGQFIGIVGDQGMPDSGYSFPFLGRRAWTSTAPALLSYKTGCPIIFASTHRTQGTYQVHYSNPIWPNLDNPLEEEIVNIMNKAMTLMEVSVQEHPENWLWQHNRWKQQTLGNLYRRFRQDSVLIIMPKNRSDFDKFYPHLSTLRSIYKNDFLSVMIPLEQIKRDFSSFQEIISYDNSQEMLLKDLKFKLVYNFSENTQVKKHYEKLSALEVIDFSQLKKLAQEHLTLEIENDIAEIIQRAICRPGSIWTKKTS